MYAKQSVPCNYSLKFLNIILFYMFKTLKELSLINHRLSSLPVMVKVILKEPTKLTFPHEFFIIVETEVHTFPFNLCALTIGCESEGDFQLEVNKNE